MIISRVKSAWFFRKNSAIKRAFTLGMRLAANVALLQQHREIGYVSFKLAVCEL